MRALLLIALTFIAGGWKASQESGVTLEGMVTRQGTSEPIQNAHVLLIAGDSSALQSLFAMGVPGVILTPENLERRIAGAPGLALNPVRLRTTTNGNGRFVFRNLPAGNYMIAAFRDGYFGETLPDLTITTAASAGVTVNPGQVPPAVVLSLHPSTTIKGQVLSGDGQPIVGAAVSAYQATYASDGRVALVPIGLSLAETENRTTTNDRGDYRLFSLPPGEYYVGVTPPPVKANASTQGEYVTTFHPSTVESRHAARVVAQGGEETVANVQIQRLPTVKISGRIASTLPGFIRPATTLYLVARESTVPMRGKPPSFVNAVTDPVALRAGQFEIHGIPPGSYDLMVVEAPWTGPLDDPGARPLGAPIPGRTHIEVTNHDLVGVVLPVHAGVDVKVRFGFDGQLSTIQRGSMRPYLRANESWPLAFETALFYPGAARGIRPRPGEPAPVAPPLVDSTGAFITSNVVEGSYVIQIQGMPPTAAITDIQAGGAKIYDDGLKVGSDSPIDVVVFISSKAATLEGTVVNGGRAPRSNVQVVLVPHPSRRQNRFLYKVAQADAAGRFTIQGIAPGEYKLFSWDSIPPNAHLNSDFIARYESLGHTVNVSDAAVLSPVQLQLIPATTDRIR